MTDIADKIKAWHEIADRSEGIAARTLRESADECERLRAALERAREYISAFARSCQNPLTQTYAADLEFRYLQEISLLEQGKPAPKWPEPLDPNSPVERLKRGESP